jgi:hypothetical protein
MIHPPRFSRPLCGLADCALARHHRARPHYSPKDQGKSTRKNTVFALDLANALLEAGRHEKIRPILLKSIDQQALTALHLIDEARSALCHARRSDSPDSLSRWALRREKKRGH